MTQYENTIYRIKGTCSTHYVTPGIVLAVFFGWNISFLTSIART